MKASIACLIAFLVLSGCIQSALAQSKPNDPAVQALSQMVQEAQAREAQALKVAYAQQAQIVDLNRELAAETKRADAATAELSASKKAP